MLKTIEETFNGSYDLSKATVITYVSALRTIAKLIDEMGYDDFNAQSIEQALRRLQELNYSRSTLIKSNAAIRHYKKIHNITGNIKKYHFPHIRTLPQYLTVKEVDKLLQSIPKLTYIEHLDYIVLLFAYTTGLRRSEIKLLEFTDINASEKIVYVRNGKRGRQRIVPICQETLDVFDVYVKQHRYVVSLKSKAISNCCFLNSFGKPISTQVLQQINKRIRTNYDTSNKRITLHTLRHAYATHMYENGADIRAIQLMLGHASINTTQLYLHCNLKHLKDIYTKHHPRS